MQNINTQNYLYTYRPEGHILELHESEYYEEYDLEYDEEFEENDLQETNDLLEVH